MKPSFLTPYPSIPGVLPTGIQDLNIERMLRYFIPDIRDLRYILQILETFETNPENILFRQELIRDLANLPEVKEALFENLDQLQLNYKDFDDYRDRFSKMTFSFSSYDETQFSLVLHQMTQLTIDLVVIYSNLNQVLQDKEVESEALRSLKEYLHSKVNLDGFTELKELLERIATNRTTAVDLMIHFNEQLQIDGCELLEVNPLTQSRKWFLGKKDIGAGTRVVMTKPTLTNFSSLYKQSLVQLIEYVFNIYTFYYDPFHVIKEDIRFYQFAFEYRELLQELNIPTCLPLIKPSDEIEFHCVDLADPLIAISAFKGQHSRIHVITNTITFDQKTTGILIKGENNTGKSVLLRSIGIAFVFGQAGLFVCANKANISIRTKLFTLFSSKEDPQQLGGRFEKEVQYFSRIIHQIDSNSCLLINEIFQSTSSIEAENALVNILNYLTKKNTLWIFVTHLRGLFDRRNELGEVRGLVSIDREDEKYKFKSIWG